MTRREAYWDKAAPQYATQPVKDVVSYEARLERVRAWLTPGMEVLELACGTGETALRLAGTGARIEGTDFSGEMIRVAQEKAAEAGANNVSFRKADLAKAAAGRRYDAVMAFNILHLIDDVEGTLAQIRGALNEGGLLLSVTPCLARNYKIRLSLLPMRLMGKEPKMRFFTVEKLDGMIRDAGFEILETGDYPKWLPNHFVVARAV
ncbi:class I SAM-dependent methyltransferase [Allosediminivita pacifica]|uniref:Ubiquinone/menaquinone biosynthesis C-methylase UbiE n=1 Tax=Allosediminivita pacifica TaxID=1267769 RepID=A0A2T6AZD9_9RHOB|nr:class I SAM-dependent methyltransferase [Allosediminivita pacifica]PTX49187.1 ubiquinone/menaquinone biosynthesis C-methylase UbiE [Allosediminivita pacifica]GGB06016.1 hypothetical protein GCM10011324_15210 [Allosediminivita pacifica]